MFHWDESYGLGQGIGIVHAEGRRREAWSGTYVEVYWAGIYDEV